MDSYPYISKFVNEIKKWGIFFLQVNDWFFIQK